MVPPFLPFLPLYQERVWGGRALAERLGRELPGEAPIGESWEVVDRPEAQSVVADGPWRGRTLREVVAAHAPEVLGASWDPRRPFPLLVKWLDCRERLSLQVHPPAAIASRLGGEPKTENWYVAEAAPGAGVLAGLKPGVDAARFRAALAAGTVEDLVERHATRAGDSILIRSGVVHAIDGGNLILEIQQNSDTTYRVYDWGRVGLDGRPRQLHLGQSIACLEANTAPPPRLADAGGPDAIVAACAEFRLRRVRLPAGAPLTGLADAAPRLVSVVAGALREKAGGLVPVGATVLVPAAAKADFVATIPTTVLVTDRFS